MVCWLYCCWFSNSNCKDYHWVVLTLDKTGSGAILMGIAEEQDSMDVYSIAVNQSRHNNLKHTNTKKYLIWSSWWTTWLMSPPLSLSLSLLNFLFLFFFPTILILVPLYKPQILIYFRKLSERNPDILVDIINYTCPLHSQDHSLPFLPSTRNHFFPLVKGTWLAPSPRHATKTCWARETNTCIHCLLPTSQLHKAFTNFMEILF